MLNEPLPCVVITGASVGIGRAFAQLIAKDKRTLLLVARNAATLNEVAAEVRQLGATAHILALDVTTADATRQISAALSAQGLYCDVLIANAGVGLIGAAADIDFVRQMGLLDLNMRVLAEQTLIFLPEMLKRGRGGVLLVASMASFVPGPFMTSYYASKAFVRSFGEGLYQENKRLGVTITTLCPGPVETEFFARAGMENIAMFKAMPHMDAMSVARAGWEGFLAGKRIVLPGLLSKLTAWTVPLLPTWLVLSVIGRLQKKRQNSRL